MLSASRSPTAFGSGSVCPMESLFWLGLQMPAPDNDSPSLGGRQADLSISCLAVDKVSDVELNTTSVGDLKSTQERPESSILRALLGRKVSHNASRGIRNMAEFLHLLP